MVLKNSALDKELKLTNDFNLKDFVLKLISIWPYIILSLVLTLSIAFVYLRYVTTIYKSSTSILIKDEKKGGGAALDNALLKELNLAANGKLIDNEIEVLKSYDLMEQVVTNLGLNVSIKSKGRVAERMLFSKLPFIVNVNRFDSTRQLSLLVKRDVAGALSFRINNVEGPFSPISLNTPFKINGYELVFNPGDSAFIQSEMTFGNSDYIIHIGSIRDATMSFLSRLKVEAASKTASVINLSLTDASQDRATKVLHELVNVYILNGLFDKNQLSAKTVDFLDKRLSLIEDDLRNVEERVANYKKLNNLTDISEESKAYLGLVSEIDVKKGDQMTQLSIIRALEDDIIKQQDKPTLVPSTLGLVEPTLLSLVERHNLLVLDYERSVSLSGPKNPRLYDISNQIKDIRIKLLENIKNLKNAFQIGLKSLEFKESELKFRLREIPAIEQNLLEIKRDLSVKSQLYYFLLEKREESAITVASAVTDSRIIERARPNGAIYPKRLTVWFLGITLGILIPIVIFLLIDFFDNKISSKKEIEEGCFAPVLGEISFVKGLETPIVMDVRGRSAVAEQIRSIRTALSYTQKGNSLKRFLITSHRSGEGKSFTSLNLAYSYALTKKRVVILEFDLRRPRISKNLSISSNKGITTFLNGQSLLDEILIKVDRFDEEFSLIPSGPIPPNPAELILGPNMQKLMDELESRFDIIVIDTPPFGLVTDAMLLMNYVDVSIVLLRQGFSFKQVLNDTNELMRQNSNRFIYTILNGIGQRSKYYYYGYGSYKYYDNKPERSFLQRIFGFLKK